VSDVRACSPGPLHLADDELVACVACGLCLPHCPTYRVTGLELASPRGRIAAMRAVEAGAVAVDDPSFVRSMDECVQCRGCEAACPSSVPFGHLMEETRAALHRARAERRPWWRRLATAIGLRVVLPRHRLLLACTWLLLVAQWLRLVPARLGIPRLSASSLRRPLDAPVGLAPAGRGTAAGETGAWLFTGCVMDAWLRDTHRSALTLLRLAGASVALAGPGGDCCGALHLHAGRRDEAAALAARVVASMPGEAPVVVDSAGCGAAMQEYGRLLGNDDGHRFAARVVDLATWLADRGPLPLEPTGRRVVVQDPCHLRTVQRAHLAVHEVLAGAYDVVATDDDGLCCGAGGAYAVLEPDLAGRIRDRKVQALRAASGDAPLVVASANPGCILHLRGAGVDVRHPADLLVDALRRPGPQAPAPPAPPLPEAP
jgi:glycolate oxidase iron-sulfur subunit